MSQEIIKDQYIEIQNLRAKLSEREKIAEKMDDCLVKTGKEVMKLAEENADLNAKLEVSESCIEELGNMYVSQLNKVKQERDNLQTMNGVLRGVLEEIEWIKTEVYSYNQKSMVSGDDKCPICGGNRNTAEFVTIKGKHERVIGHFPGCKLNQALAKFRGGNE